MVYDEWRNGAHPFYKIQVLHMCNRYRRRPFVLPTRNNCMDIYNNDFLWCVSYACRFGASGVRTCRRYQTTQMAQEIANDYTQLQTIVLGAKTVHANLHFYAIAYKYRIDDDRNYDEKPAANKNEYSQLEICSFATNKVQGTEKKCHFFSLPL